MSAAAYHSALLLDAKPVEHAGPVGHAEFVESVEFVEFVESVEFVEFVESVFVDFESFCFGAAAAAAVAVELRPNCSEIKLPMMQRLLVYSAVEASAAVAEHPGS